MAAMWPSRIAISAAVPGRARAIDNVAVADDEIVALSEQTQREEKQNREFHSPNIPLSFGDGPIILCAHYRRSWQLNWRVTS